MFRIPVYQPDLSGNEKLYVNRCLDSSWISSKGEYIKRFETGFADFIGTRHATAVSNGTVALHLALLALGIGPGDEVLVPTLTYIASVNAITYTGATPVFVDSLPDTWQIDPLDAERKITYRTKAIMAVHLYGHPCDMAALKRLADTHGLLLVEDCAEAIGTRCGDRHVGTFGDVATFSFYGNKTITTGEGGMLITDNDALYDKAFRIKGQGLALDREYWHDIVGYNYRMTNICAAIGLAQLEKADIILKRKREIALYYRSALAGSPVVFHDESDGTTHSFWMCCILVPRAADRDPLRERLAAAGIETRPLFFPIHTMPMYTGVGVSLPVAEDIAARGINLPSWPGLAENEILEICDLIRSFFAPSANTATHA